MSLCGFGAYVGELNVSASGSPRPIKFQVKGTGALSNLTFLSLLPSPSNYPK